MQIAPENQNIAGIETFENTGYETYLRRGFFLIFALIGGFALWSIFAPIQGAVIAPGTVVVEGEPKTIQHLDGGIIGEIFVREGDKVKAGDVLLRLDSTSVNASRDLFQKRLDEAEAFRARLLAERDNRSAIDWKRPFPLKEKRFELSALIDDQTQLFEARRQGFKSQLGQLRKQRERLVEQVSGFQEQIKANQIQLDIITKELDGLRGLLENGFVSQTRVLSLEREQAALSGNIALKQSQIASTRAQIGETEIEASQLGQVKTENILTELRAKESEVSDLKEQLISAVDQASRVEVVAPVSGSVHNLLVTTIGGVVTTANPLMDIIPDSERLIIKSQIQPMHIDQVYPGQTTTIRLSAFNQRKTPELTGNVISVSANTSIDPVTGFPFYTVRIEIPPQEIARLKGLKLVPGMPAEAFMQTDKRTLLNFLLKPASDQLNRAFKEE